MPRLVRCLLLSLLLLAHDRLLAQTDDEQAVARLRQRVEFLASDELEGRGIGSAGLNWAGDYIADEFNAIGLQRPQGWVDYFQSFEAATSREVARDTALWFGARELKLHEDFRPLSFSAEGMFSGPIVFAGYGVSRDDYDDYAGLDVNGKVVLVLRYEPHDAQGQSRFTRSQNWSEDATLPAKARAALSRGAAALLLVNPPTHHGEDRLVPFGSVGGADAVKIPFVQITAKAADDLLYRANLPTLRKFQEQIDTVGQPASRAVGDVTARGQIAVGRVTKPVRNVIGILPATSDAFTGEYMMVCAHYDHIGRQRNGDGPEQTGMIHNGADDNASGTAAMLELARRLSSSHAPRPRTIVFAAFTGEERGLLGSQHFADHPLVPLDKIIAVINLDMVGRVANDTLYIGGHGTAKSFDGFIKSTDDRSPLMFKSIGSGGYGPSDHMTFAAKGIPVLFLFTGLHMDYHRPTDDANKVNYLGMLRVVDFTQSLVEQVLAMPREEYVKTVDVGGSQGRFGGPQSRVTLGVIPDYDHDRQGARISGTVPSSPAATAGMEAGDTIVSINGQPITSVYDLSTVLATTVPGDRARIAVLRNGQTIELDVTLAERKGQ